MKKVWENPELNGLGVDETKEEVHEVRYSTIRTYDMRGSVKYLCRGVFISGTTIKIADCPNPGPYDSLLEFGQHAQDMHSGLQIGEDLVVTPVS